MPFDQEKLKQFPVGPGVYLMKGKAEKILYVGKAKNLKARVKQYFAKGGDGRAMIPQLIRQVESIETIVVSSEKEALLVENTLIKKHQPKYNVFLKDDKSYANLVITTKEKWPMIKLARFKGAPEKNGTCFGPYTNAGAAKKTLDLLNRLFPLRQCSDREFANRTRPCLLYGMGRCSAPCVGLIQEEEYREHVNRTVQFLEGKNQIVLRDLKQKMEEASATLEFERAGQILQTIREIEATLERQSVHQVGGKDRDVIGIYREGEEISVAVLYYREGKLVDSKHYPYSHVIDEDDSLLEAFLIQRYQDAIDSPHEILIPIQLDGAEMISELLSEGKKRKVVVKSAQRGDLRKLLETAEENAKATFHKEKDQQSLRDKMLLQLQEKFHLQNYPRRIECIDISNISGSNPVGSLVTYINGMKENGEYRKYKIKSIEGQDDYAAMYEVLLRRLKRAKEEDKFPDLMILDGGKGQLNIGLKIFQELNIINIDLISLSKEEGKHDKGLREEKVFLPNIKDPIYLKKNSSLLFFIQNIRDEAHRFAITYQKTSREKTLFCSILDAIPGIGPVKKARLLKHFGSVKMIQNATRDQLEMVQGMTKKDVDAILEFKANGIRAAYSR